MITLMSTIRYSRRYLPVEAHYQCGDKLNYSDRCSHLDHTVTPSLHVIAASQLLVMTIMPALAGPLTSVGTSSTGDHWPVWRPGAVTPPPDTRMLPPVAAFSRSRQFLLDLSWSYLSCIKSIKWILSRIVFLLVLFECESSSYSVS